MYFKYLYILENTEDIVIDDSNKSIEIVDDREDNKNEEVQAANTEQDVSELVPGACFNCSQY